MNLYLESLTAYTKEVTNDTIISHIPVTKTIVRISIDGRNMDLFTKKN